MAKKSFPEVNTLLPKEGTGWHSRKPDSNRWGLPETIDTLQLIGTVWSLTHPKAPRIGFGDISLKGGGDFFLEDGTPPHASHKVGLDVDVRLMRNDGIDRGVRSFKSKAYSQELTQQLVDEIRENPLLSVKRIIFDDTGVTGVKKDGNHKNHLHVRFCRPAKYKGKLKTRAKYDCKEPPLISTITPQEGHYYQIQKGDNLFKVAGVAYGVKAGGERLRLAQMVNDCNFNRRFWSSPSQNEIKWFPKGRISFLPKFATFEEQYRAQGKVPRGNFFARTWIPCKS